MLFVHSIEAQCSPHHADPHKGPFLMKEQEQHQTTPERGLAEWGDI
jgi:hypothetical protein